MNAPFDPKKVLHTQSTTDGKTPIYYLEETQCHLESLSDMLLQVVNSYESTDPWKNEDIRNSFKAFLSVCESLANLALENFDKFNLMLADVGRIREKIYGLSVGINEVSYFSTNIGEITGTLYGLSYVSKYLQSEINRKLIEPLT